MAPLDPHDFIALDAFESSLYERRRVTATAADGAHAEVFTYVITPSARSRLTPEAWDYEAFRLRNLARYLRAV